jgi:hypothetical protein
MYRKNKDDLGLNRYTGVSAEKGWEARSRG